MKKLHEFQQALCKTLFVSAKCKKVVS